MRIVTNRLHKLSVEQLQAAIRGIAWALDDDENIEEREAVELFLWYFESELLTRGIVPDKAS
jgi:hypothetical protein